MPLPDLVVAKLDRARQHLKSFESEVAEFLGPPRPYRVTVDRQADQVTDVYRFWIVKEPPADLSLIVGDFLHNLRSFLDHLVYALAIAHSGTLRSEVARDCGFPIAQAIEQLDTKKIRAVAPDVVTIIEGLQPYHRPKPSYHPLAALQRLDNINKHRTLHLVYMTVRTVGWFGDAELVYMASGPLEDGTEIVRFVWPSPPEAKVKVDPSISIHIAFGKGLPASTTGVVGVLERLLRYVETEVVPRLESFL